MSRRLKHPWCSYGVSAECPTENLTMSLSTHLLNAESVYILFSISILPCCERVLCYSRQSKLCHRSKSPLWWTRSHWHVTRDRPTFPPRVATWHYTSLRVWCRTRHESPAKRPLWRYNASHESQMVHLLFSVTKWKRLVLCVIQRGLYCVNGIFLFHCPVQLFFLGPEM